MPTPEELARENIDPLLTKCGWEVQDRKSINLDAARGIAIREALLKGGDEVDYLLFADKKAIGTVEAKPEGFTLTGVEEQSGKYGENLLDIYPRWRDPLPFAYESTESKHNSRTNWILHRKAAPSLRVRVVFPVVQGREPAWDLQLALR